MNLESGLPHLMLESLKEARRDDWIAMHKAIKGLSFLLEMSKGQRYELEVVWINDLRTKWDGMAYSYLRNLSSHLNVEYGQ